ncbi:MAG: sulfotransferase [Magnetococcus sp. YQC-9]
MRFLDLSGYMFSGKAALSDLLREFEGISVPDYRSEFDLLRIPHGLMDLKLAFDQWSWVRSDAAVRNFIKLTNTLARTPKGLWERAFLVGFGYDRRFPGFRDKTERFVGRITDATWRMQWPYEVMNISPFRHFWHRLWCKLKGIQGWPEIEYHLCSGENFSAYAKEYLVELLIPEEDRNNRDIYVTHNMLEPYQPEAAFGFFDDIRAIVVDRDVRDIYMTGSHYSVGFNDRVALYSRIIGAFDIDIFIKRQKILRNRTQYGHHPRVLRIRFEDLVERHEETLERILAFLDMDRSAHIRPGLAFQPASSQKNIGLWRQATGEAKANIHKIEQALPELCFQ